MKKIWVSLLLLLAVAGSASAGYREGHIAYAGMTVEEYNSFVPDLLSNDAYVWHNYKIDDPEYARLIGNFLKPESLIPFDSFSEMLMALDAGKIDIMELSQPVAEYFFKLKGNNEKYLPYVITQGVMYYLSMGFKEGNKWFELFNETIKAMNEDKTLLFLKAQYVMDSDENPKPVKFENFPDAETVKIAVTGDMPPIDYVAADGTPAGFNTAMLAEIARRLKINVELVSINAGARAATLASGRADGVFWFW
ncbi:MAG: transporter substrate-binding domain-containing protein, partial [Synergistaceae bacterium]|nr:transporter substrate-binding domain-containing protein [Synergistaceae bacterium]